MIVNVNINNDYEINCLNDLVKLNMDGIKTNCICQYISEPLY